ncbi:hypothetical protein HH212_00855 [Massilia forsythiae]|uniref:Lipoprotein n=1 Tax=Massilia forsythiae TaxID=2728020 RepID=A0A7Z2ZQU4_9BURK|nr:hypothetical protein [Massilia forsythiae]QJD98767.1 hypothetical protein HH212_00855 [Massilia forsythiae]
MRKLLHYQAVLVVLAACAACSSQAQTPPQTAPSAKPVRGADPAPAGATRARIQSLVGTASCASDAECRSMPLGAKACGGPESYLAWSTRSTKESELGALAERYKAQRQAENQASGMMSDCRFLPDPGAICRAGTCQLGEGKSNAS